VSKTVLEMVEELFMKGAGHVDGEDALVIVVRKTRLV
jgi:hypothetical protein